MANTVCPACGSRYFLTQRGGGDRQVFTVGGNGEPLQVADSRETERLEVIPLRIYCGACCWQGANVTDCRRQPQPQSYGALQ